MKLGCCAVSTKASADPAKKSGAGLAFIVLLCGIKGPGVYIPVSNNHWIDHLQRVAWLK